MVNIPGLKFDLGDDIEMLRDSLQQFTANEIAPLKATAKPKGAKAPKLSAERAPASKRKTSAKRAAAAGGA